MPAVPKPKKTKSRKKGVSDITKQDYERMIDEFGECCMICGKYPAEAHHLVFRSQSSNGNWRNLAPLCNACHTRAHRQREFADYLREMRAERFGQHYGKSAYALYLAGFIEEPSEQAYELLMRREER